MYYDKMYPILSHLEYFFFTYYYFIILNYSQHTRIVPTYYIE